MQKSHVVLSLAIASLAACVVTVSLALPVRANPPVAMTNIEPVAAASESAPIPALEVPEDPDTKDPYVASLADYLTDDIISHWTPAVRQVPSVSPLTVAWDVARAVAHEADDPGHCGLMPSDDGRQRCLWGVPGWNSDHAKAVLLAAVAYWEGARYAQAVNDGSCNDAGWRADPANAPLIHMMGNCDHGRAHSLWQIWPRVGASSASPINESCSLDAVSTRYGAARCALQLLRMSMMAKGDLTAYTGESGWDVTKATLRLEFARKALKKHPFKR